MATPIEEGRHGSLAISAETTKVKFGFAQRFQTQRVEGEVGGEVELEKDQKPAYRLGGRINWD